ncbi:MAG TPA: HipA family kinase [Candidatus Limnocylindrales bacterium]
MLRTVVATRYATPLREGGSVPGVVEADDDGLYVVKFRGAGQGPKALVAELIAGEIARHLGLLVPELVLVEFDAALAAGEPDPEIQEVLARSAGRNVGLDFLPGALTFDRAVDPRPSREAAAAVVWFDGLVTNVDRTPRNPNLLSWHRRMWLIDHGAALYIHHRWRDPLEHARRPMPQLRDHVLLPLASSIGAVDEALAGRLGRAELEAIVAAVPDEWLAPEAGLPDPAAHRRAYLEYLLARLAPPRPFVEEADRARVAA